jgi:LysM repeat protein
MSKFQKLAKINKIANECIQDGNFVLASKFHNEFMKIAQNQSEDKYTVKANDTLTSIVNFYAEKGLSTSAEKIRKRNNLEVSTLYQGSKLIIPLEGNPMKPKISEEPEM